MISTLVAISILATVSLVINGVMVWYARSSLANIDKIYAASENTVEIFSRIDSFKEHLTAVYDMPTFYGDDTLQSLLEHTSQMIDFLKLYDTVYSFTQPDLEEQLLAASLDVKENDEEEVQE